MDGLPSPVDVNCDSPIETADREIADYIFILHVYIHHLVDLIWSMLPARQCCSLEDVLSFCHDKGYLAPIDS